MFNRMVEQQPDDLDLDAVFKALGHPIRREILEQLADGPESVSELAEPHDVSLAAVSKHLRVLEDAGLLDVEEACIFQHAQVLRNRRQRHVVGFGQLADALRPVRELFKDLPTDRVAQRLEDRVEVQVVRLLFNHPVKHTAVRGIKPMD